MALAIEDEIRRFHVAMQHAFAMSIGKRLGSLHADARDAAIELSPALAGREFAVTERLLFGPCGVAGRWRRRIGSLDADVGRVIALALAIRVRRKAPRQHSAGRAQSRVIRGDTAPLIDVGSSSKAFDDVDHQVQTLSLDVLHRVVVDPVMLADAEHGNDVRVMQPSGGPRFQAKSLQMHGIEQPGGGQHLERDVPVQGPLDGFVDDAHPAAADFSNDGKIADLAKHTGRDRRLAVQAVVGLGMPLQQRKRRQQFTQLVGQLGAAARVLFDAGSLAGPQPGDEDVGDLLEIVADVRRFVGHGSAGLGIAIVQSMEFVLQVLQGAFVTFARGRRFDAEHFRRFDVGELFKVAQSEHLAVDGLERIERLLEPSCFLQAHGGLAGTAGVAQELCREAGAGRLGDHATMQGLLAADVARLGAQMPPVLLH
jgi:hypothetical protein